MSLEYIATAGAVQTLPAAAAGATPAPPAVAWTNGAYAEIVASTASAFVLVGVSAFPGIATACSWEIDIATGPAASEVVIATVTGAQQSQRHINYLPLSLPVDNIPAGVRLSTRIRYSSTNTSAWLVAVSVIAKPYTGVLTTTSAAPKVYPSAAGSIALSPPDTTWGNSGWVEVVASTTDAILLAGVVALNPSAGGAAWQTEIDVGVGVAASEVVVTTIRVGQILDSPGYFPLRPLLDNIPSGSRIAVRARGQSSTSSFSIRLSYYEKSAAGNVSAVTTALPLKWLPSAAAPIACPQSGTNWLNGAYQEFSASLAADSQIAALCFATSVGPDHELDIATGAAASEVVQASIRVTHSSSASAGYHELSLPAPVDRFPAGSRLAVRCRGNGNNTAGIQVALGYYEGLTGNLVADSAPLALPAAADNVSVTPSGTAWVSSTWTQLAASLASNSQIGWLTYVQGVSQVEFEFDIGVGAASSEVVVQTVRGNVGSSINAGSRYMYLPVSYPIPVGSRVAIRMRKTGTSTAAWTFAAGYYTESLSTPGLLEGLAVILLEEAW